MKKQSWLFMGALFLLGCAENDVTQEVTTNNPLLSAQDRAVDARLRPYFGRGEHIGGLVGVYRQGAVSWYEYGETARGSGQRPNARSLFEIGSVTKPFTAALVADWLQQQQLPLETPVADFLPADARAGVRKNGRTLTFRQLLDYSSGLPEDKDVQDLTTAPGYTPANPFQHYDSSRVYRYLTTFGLKHMPGSTYTYSNLAFGLAGLILERNTRKRYETLVLERIAGPLQLADTRVTLSAEQERRMAQGHDAAGRPVARWKSLGGFAGAGILVSSGEDLLRFGQAQLRTATPLENLLALTRQPSFYSEKEGWQGLGWLLTDPSLDGVLKNGGTGGYRSLLVVSKAKQMVVVALFNNDDDAALTTAGYLAADLLSQ